MKILFILMFTSHSAIFAQDFKSEVLKKSYKTETAEVLTHLGNQFELNAGYTERDGLLGNIMFRLGLLDYFELRANSEFGRIYREGKLGAKINIFNKHDYIPQTALIFEISDSRIGGGFYPFIERKTLTNFILVSSWILPEEIDFSVNFGVEDIFDDFAYMYSAALNLPLYTYFGIYIEAYSKSYQQITSTLYDIVNDTYDGKFTTKSHHYFNGGISILLFGHNRFAISREIALDYRLSKVFISYSLGFN